MGDIELASAADHDSLCTVQFAAASYAEPEACRFVNISIVREGDTSSAVSVMYETCEGSASAGQDYVHKSERIEFQPGQVQLNTPTDLPNARVTPALLVALCVL